MEFSGLLGVDGLFKWNGKSGQVRQYTVLAFSNRDSIDCRS